MIDLLRAIAFTIAMTVFVLVVGCSERKVTQQENQVANNADLASQKSEPLEPAMVPAFVESAGDLNLDFIHTSGSPEDFFMPRSLGSGIALLDVNLDGRLDVYLLQNAGPGSGSPNQLFIQSPEGIFYDATRGSGLDIEGFCMGVAVGDVNNDGLPDLCLNEYTGSRLLVNQGDHTFRDITEIAGISNSAWAASACFLDFNRDGWLDLAVVNYLDYSGSNKCWGKNGAPEFCGPDGFPPTVTRLFENRTGHSGNGQGVQFVDVTATSGLIRHPGPGLGILGLDFNDDGWVDLFLADDGAPNRLFINQKDGTFKEEATLRGLALDGMGRTRADMGVAFGDVDQDGFFDLFVTHLQTENHTLWKQSPPGIFTDKTSHSQLNRSSWRGTAFGTVLCDLDLDGDQDLVLVNGDIRRNENVQGPFPPELSAFWMPYAQRSQFFLNTGEGVFQDHSEAIGDLSLPATVGRGLACGDLNNDGLPDLLISSIGSRLRVLMNQTHTTSNWLLLSLIEPEHGGRFSMAATVEVHVGDRVLKRWHNPSYSYLCSNDPRVHFGLGENAKVDRIKVTWPDGNIESFPGQKANQILVIEKGRGQPLSN